MKTKKSKQLPAVTAGQFDTAMAQYTGAGTREHEIRAAIEVEINDILEKYREELDTLAKTKQTAFETAQLYCTANKGLLFAKRRSIATGSGLAGFRLGTPRLKTAKGSNWGSIITMLKEKLPTYIRTVEEPAKDLLLADRNKENVAPLLVEIGIEVVQDDLFYIEPKKAA